MSIQNSFAWVLASGFLTGLCATSHAQSTLPPGKAPIQLAATSPTAPTSPTTEQAVAKEEEMNPAHSLIPPSFPTDMLWVALSLNGVPYNMEVNRPTFTLTSSKTVIGFGGCNRFTSTAQWNPEALDISPFALTHMTCSPKEMALENAYLSALRNVNRWSKDKHGLLKLSGEKGTLIFERALITH